MAQSLDYKMAIERVVTLVAWLVRGMVDELAATMVVALDYWWV